MRPSNGFSNKAAGALTEERLARVTAEWQARLRLQDWDIETQIVHAHELGGEHVGELETSRQKAFAQLRVLHRDDLAAFRSMNPDAAGDWELTVVHELVHLALKGAMRRKPSQHQIDTEERAVHNIARALLGLYRVTREIAAEGKP